MGLGWGRKVGGGLGRESNSGGGLGRGSNSSGGRGTSSCQPFHAVRIVEKYSLSLHQLAQLAHLLPGSARAATEALGDKNIGDLFIFVIVSRMEAQDR